MRRAHFLVPGLLWAAGCSPKEPDQPPAVARVCADATDLPVAEPASGLGTRYCGAVCLEVQAELGTDRLDLCAGTVDVNVDGDSLYGTGVCRYVGLEGHTGFGALFPEDQSAAVEGTRSGDAWAGTVTVRTSVGDFTWDWFGTWSGEGSPISGEVAGVSDATVGRTAVTVEGDGWFDVSPEACGPEEDAQ